jgi:hypothetical protein
MPSIDLARLRKQVARLADFFFVPDEFIPHLHSILDSYVNYTARKRPATPPSIKLRTYRTPAPILKGVEEGLSRLAAKAENADAALDLADRLWDEAWLETCLLAAFLLGCIPPQEEHFLARIMAWTAQVRDPELRARLLDTSLVRLRKESPDMFLDLLDEWLRPERAHLWPDGIQAVISAVSDPDFMNLPPLLEVIKPIVEAAPADLQLALETLILALYRASPKETTYFVRQVLLHSDDPMTAITFRRILPSLPEELKAEVRDLIRSRPVSAL